MPSADADITSLFKPDIKGPGFVQNRAPLVSVLGQAMGLTIPDGPLNDRMKRSAVSVTSHFQGRDCDPAKKVGMIPGGGGSGGGGGSSGEVGSGTLIEVGATPQLIAGGGATLAKRKLLEGKLLSLEHAIADFRSALPILLAADDPPVPGGGAGPGPGPAPGGTAVVAEGEKPRCWNYRDSEHGPIGLFRAREFLQVEVSGHVDLLGGLKHFAGRVSVIMYLEYGVNTYLKGKPAWKMNTDTNQPEFDNKVVLDADRRCGGGHDQACQSDTVTDTMRVVVNFKKLFIAEVGTDFSGLTSSGAFNARVTSLIEESYAGIVTFTHSMSPSP